MVQYIVDAFTSSPTRVEVPDVTLDHLEGGGDGQRGGEDIVKIPAVAGGEIVDADYLLAEGK